MNNKTIVTVCAVALVFALVVLPAWGQGNSQGKKGQASLLVETTCALDVGDTTAELKADTTLTNKSSGDVAVEVQDGSEIQGTYKEIGVPGNVYFDLSIPSHTISEQGIAAGASVSESASCNLCLAQDEVKIARELNATVTVVYGPPFDPAKEVSSRCTSADGGGIKVDAAVFAEIATACGWTF